MGNGKIGKMVSTKNNYFSMKGGNLKNEESFVRDRTSYIGCNATNMREEKLN